MLEFYSDYLIRQAFENHEINEKFTFEDIVENEDLSYMTQEGIGLLKDKINSRIDENKSGIIKLTDTESLDGIVFKKVARKIKNENYFSNKIY